MKAKTKTSKRPPAPVSASLPIEDDERHRYQVDGYVARNRDALNESIRRTRQEFAEGKISAKSFDDIIAEGRKRLVKCK
jgi:antitoxin ParD1/3/4